MAAHDPETRKQAASTAARARLAALTPDQRRHMTVDARAALHEADLADVDDEARAAGEHPLDPTERQARAQLRRAERALIASRASAIARAQRRDIQAERELGDQLAAYVAANR